MSSSDPDSKIDFLDTPEAVKRKIKKAFCEEGNVTENGLLAFIKAVLIPISELRLERLRGETGEDEEEGKEATGSQKPFATDDAPEGTVFTITREKGGGPSHYKTYQELEDDFAAKKIHPGDLKANVRDAIISLLEPIRAAFLADEEWQKIERLAYPDPNAKKGPKKKKARLIAFCWIVSCTLTLTCRRRCTILHHREKAKMPKSYLRKWTVLWLTRRRHLNHLKVSLMEMWSRHEEQM